MTINLDEFVIDRTPLEKAIHLESLRAELEKLGYTAVSTDWLRRLNKEIIKRKLDAQ
jgi:hypothetical protein